MKKKLSAFVFCIILLFGGLYFSVAQQPQILPIYLKIADLKDVSTTAPTNNQILKYNSTTALWTPAADGTGTDVKVGIDSGATAGYLGAASSDGVLRTDSDLTYTDGGNFVTLGLAATPTVTGLQASGATLLLQDDAAQNVKFFASAGAGENPYVYIYGDDSGTPKYFSIQVDPTGYALLEAEGGTLRITAASYINLQKSAYMTDNQPFSFGGGIDYGIKFYTTTNLLEGNAAGTCIGVSMEHGTWIVTKAINHDDTSPVTCATVADGYTIEAVWVEIVEVWDGNGTIEIGDGADDNGFLPDAAITQTSTGYYGDITQNWGAYLWDGTSTKKKTYTGADTVDATLVVGTSTQGQAIVYVQISRKK